MMKALNDQNSNSASIKKFTAFLEKNNLRKTPERFAIFNCILKINNLFTIDFLSQQMASSVYHVSRATLYNTIDLLTQCGIIRRHVFEGMQPQYERVTAVPHSYLICSCCNKIKEVRDKNFIAFMNANKKITAFTVTHYSLYVYGVCNTCARKMKRANAADDHNITTSNSIIV